MNKRPTRDKIAVHLSANPAEYERRLAALKTLAARLGFVYAGEGNVSRLLKAIADGQAEITLKS